MFNIYYLPHFLIILLCWKMTIGPGVLFLHHLKYIKIFESSLFNEFEIFDIKPEKKIYCKINAYQIVNIPYVQDFFFEISLPFLLIFYLIYYYFFSIKIPNIDFFLIGLSIFLLFLSNFKIIRENIKNFFNIPTILSFLSLLILPLIYFLNSNFLNLLNFKKILILEFLSFFQGYSLSISPIFSSKGYFTYSNIDSSIISIDEYQSSLRRIYSNFSSFMFFIWNFIDLILFLSFLILIYLNKFENISLFLIILKFINFILIIFILINLIQVYLINFLLPYFKINKNKNIPKLNDLLKPLGSIIFSILSLPIIQIIFSLILIQIKLLNLNNNWQNQFFSILLLNGHFISLTKHFIKLND